MVLLACVLAVSCSAVASADESGTAGETQAADIAFFETQIAPILKRRCYACHSHEFGKAKGGLVLDSRHGWETGGNAGAAIVPGRPGESLLIEAVRYESYEMPPDKPLPANEIALLEQWIARGAPDPRAAQAPVIDASQQWALQPITKPLVPLVQDTEWLRDDLDAFIIRRLEDEGMSPVADADRYTLLRRLTFDLTGLPPTPQAIAAFLNDTSEHAYQDVVDRLLASPAFGDRWARHWFDLSCYADLADIQGDMLIRDAWRYRDYVIHAFNSDKPLDRFILEQLAGDLLPYETVEQRREQLIATGYLAIGPWTLQNYIKGQLDADVVDHQIDRIGRTFLAQTISCARCHDHKFDPVPTADYYALAGIFHSTLTTSYDGPGVWSAIHHTTLPARVVSPAERARRQQELAELHDQQQAAQAELTAQLLSIPGGTEANVLTLVDGLAANAEGVHYSLRFLAGPTVWAAASQATLAGDGLQIDLLRADGTSVAGFRHYPEPWGRTKESQTLTPAQFSYTGDGSGPISIRITSANHGNSRFGGAIDDLVIHETSPNSRERPVADSSVAEEEGKLIFRATFDDLLPGTIQGSQADTGLRVVAQAQVPGWSGGGINHSHAVDLGEGNLAIQFFGGRAQELAAAQPVTAAEKQAHRCALELQQQLAALTARITALASQDAPESTLAVRDVEQPADSPIYRRGDFQSLGEIVPRGFLGAVPVSTSYDIPPNTSGRLQLAAWLTDPTHPLTSRVLVNRIWHHLFGQGIVRTVDYFGVHGETPSHPELLDFLAVRLREDGWSLKKTVRRMVLSHTYRLASTCSTAAVERDPDARLLSHRLRRRLEAEAIRDAMLMASGELDPSRGGPSLGLELDGNIQGAGGNVNPPTWGGKIPDYINQRRSVYLPLRRGRPSGELEILSAFDFPHTNDIVGARPHTTVATQALFLLNAPLVKQQARKLAERLEREEPDDERARVQHLYLLTVGRPAAAAEVDMALAFLEQCAPQLADDRNAAWAQLSHAVFGSNAFLFRE